MTFMVRSDKLSRSDFLPSIMSVENQSSLLSRRDFLKLGGLALGSLAFSSLPREWQGLADSFEVKEALNPGNIEYLPNKTIEIEGKFRPNKAIMVYNFPLRTDLTFDPKQKVAVFEMPPQANLSYYNFYYCRDLSSPVDQQIRRMTVIPNTMGTNNLAIAELDRGKFDARGNYLPVGAEHPGLNHRIDSILGDVSYVVGDEKVYPNKVLNLLNAMAYILEHQEQSGPLRKNKVYSYLELISLADGADYVPGYTSSLAVVRGGGICAGATAISNVFWGVAKSLGIDYKNTYQAPKFSHPERYKLGPFASDTFITDTTVQINNDGTKYDYNLIPPRDLYFNIRAAVIPNGVAFSETNPQGLYITNDSGSFLRSDVQFVLNIGLTTDQPQTKADDLRAIRQQYIDFRSSNHQGKTNIMENGCRFSGNFGWSESNKVDFGPKIYPEQDTRLFTNEIAQSNYLRDVLALQKLLNSIEDIETRVVSGLVRNSEWYRNKVARGETSQPMEGAINQLDAVAIRGQRVQCIAWATLLAGLPYPGMPISIGSVPIAGPIDLIPNSILTYPDRQTALSPTGGKVIAERDMEIGDINEGDLFLMRSSSVGHVGVVLGRKQYGGKQYLLVTESNRHNDGRIQIYTVDEHNFNAKLGMPPEKKILLRK
ncbi:twin-arginine translocation signal domain-containing protein [bacterium]|nr:MAG: twin-arginine translocation signal domain-containing protein [bacterium]